MFPDRRVAGARLAEYLTTYVDPGADAVVVTLTPGGREVGEVVATALALPLAAAQEAPSAATAVLVDDGYAGAGAVVAAIRALRAAAGEVVYAIPIAEPEAPAAAWEEADTVVCVRTPQQAPAEGWYAGAPAGGV